MDFFIEISLKALRYTTMGSSLDQAIAVYPDAVPIKRFVHPEGIVSILKFLALSESPFLIREEIIEAVVWVIMIIKKGSTEISLPPHHVLSDR